MTYRRLQNLRVESTAVSIKLPIDRIEPVLIHWTHPPSKQPGIVWNRPIAGGTLSPEGSTLEEQEYRIARRYGDEGISMEGQRIAFVTAGWPPTGSGSRHAERFRF